MHDTVEVANIDTQLQRAGGDDGTVGLGGKRGLRRTALVPGKRGVRGECADPGRTQTFGDLFDAGAAFCKDQAPLAAE